MIKELYRDMVDYLAEELDKKLMKCVSCEKEGKEVCGDGFCRECHVDLSFEDCCDGTYLARRNLAKGRSVEETKELYPTAKI